MAVTKTDQNTIVVNPEVIGAVTRELLKLVDALPTFEAAEDIARRICIVAETTRPADPSIAALDAVKSLHWDYKWGSCYTCRDQDGQPENFPCATAQAITAAEEAA